jgi:hypothetical protein
MAEPTHKMRMAKLSPRLAKRMGLSSNHHARVWCECMNGSVKPPGYYSMRPEREAVSDTRRLGSWDWIGVVDLRVPNSALDLFRQHITKELKAS